MPAWLRTATAGSCSTSGGDMAIFRHSTALVLIASLASGPALLTLPAIGWAQVEEIVVTTRKREESLQEVPIAVNAIGADEIDRKAILLEDHIKSTGDHQVRIRLHHDVEFPVSVEVVAS